MRSGDIEEYPNDRGGLGTTPKLLSMERPEKPGYERYWTGVVKCLKQVPWWQSPEPKQQIETK